MASLATKIETLLKTNLFAFDYYLGDTSNYGDHACQSPIWIRPRSLLSELNRFETEIVQIVGHTQLLLDQNYFKKIILCDLLSWNYYVK